MTRASDTCSDCERRRGIRRGLGVLFYICDPCWLLRVLYGPPRRSTLGKAGGA